VRGCELVFLPAHSLDFTPIERAFSKTKSIPRRLGARAHDTLLDALYQAVSAVTAQDTWGWFTSVGYTLPAPPL
jgi:transposase